MHYLTMKTNRRKFTSKFKSRVVLEVISERETISEIALKFDLHRNQIAEWKKEFISKAHLVFEIEDFKLNEKLSDTKKNNKRMSEKIFTSFMTTDI